MKKGLLKIFLSGFVILAILIAIQQSKYHSEQFIPWIWLFLLYFPILLVTFQIREKFKLKISELKWMSIFFVLFSVLVLLLPPLLGFSSIKAIKLSTIFLLPLELFLCYLIFFKIIKKQPKETTDEYISEEPIVFISYNHEDKDVAQK